MCQKTCFRLVCLVIGIAFSVSAYAQEEVSTDHIAIKNLDLSISLLVPKAVAAEEDAILQSQATLLVQIPLPAGSSNNGSGVAAGMLLLLRLSNTLPSGIPTVNNRTSSSPPVPSPLPSNRLPNRSSKPAA